MLAEKEGLVQHVFGAARMNEMTFEQFAPLDRQTLGARAYTQIADLMISGKLAPGEKLSLSLEEVDRVFQHLLAQGVLGQGSNRHYHLRAEQG